MLGDLLCKYMVRLARRQIGKAGWCSAHAFRSVSLSCQTQKLFHEEYAVYVLSYHASIELLHRLKASPTKTAFLSFVEVPNDPPEWRGLQQMLTAQPHTENAVRAIQAAPRARPLVLPHYARYHHHSSFFSLLGGLVDML